MRWQDITAFLSINTTEEFIALLVALASFLIGIILVILIIVLIYKKRKERVMRKKLEEEGSYVGQLEKLKRRRGNPSESLKLLSKLVKSFFKEYLNTSLEMTYEEIAKRLREKGKIDMAGFCNEISYYLYSNREFSTQDIADLEEKFKRILQGRAINKKQIKATEKIERPTETREKKLKEEKEKIKRIARKIKRKPIKRIVKKSFKKLKKKIKKRKRM